MKYEFPWKVRDKEAFERSAAAAFPNGDWLARAVVEKFDSDIRVHPGGWSASKLANAEEQVWQYGPVSVRYRLLPATQQVEVLSVSKGRVSGLRQWGLYFIHLWHRYFPDDKPAANPGAAAGRSSVPSDIDY
jgi:hypothetical protein